MENTRFKANDNFAISEVAGETVIVPVSDSVDTLNNLFVLNETGAFIINMMNEGKNLGEIADALVASYEIDRETALNDASEYAKRAVERGFFTVEQ
ncbi:MAG: PqqD family protein [Bacteroidales bacterium]|nr:PqqD family protein [Bacteroidales bacterium]